MCNEYLLLDSLVQDFELLIHVARSERFQRRGLGCIVVEGYNEATSVVGSRKLAFDLSLDVALLFGGRDAVIKVYQVTAPKVVAEVVVVEVRHLYVCLNPSVPPDVFGQRIVLHACCIHTIVKQLLSEAVLRVECRYLFDVAHLREQLHHVVVVPVSHLKHLVLFVNPNLLERHMLHLGNRSQLGPSNRNRKAVE